MQSAPYPDRLYICSTYKKKPKGACTKHTVRSDKVEEAVLITLQRLIDLSVDTDALARVMNHKQGTSSCLLHSAISQKEQQKASLERLQLSLYPDWKNGDITGCKADDPRVLSIEFSDGEFVHGAVNTA